MYTAIGGVPVWLLLSVALVVAFSAEHPLLPHLQARLGAIPAATAAASAVGAAPYPLHAAGAAGPTQLPFLLDTAASLLGGAAVVPVVLVAPAGRLAASALASGCILAAYTYRLRTGGPEEGATAANGGGVAAGRPRASTAGGGGRAAGNVAWLRRELWIWWNLLPAPAVRNTADE